MALAIGTFQVDNGPARTGIPKDYRVTVSNSGVAPSAAFDIASIEVTAHESSGGPQNTVVAISQVNLGPNIPRRIDPGGFRTYPGTITARTPIGGGLAMPNTQNIFLTVTVRSTDGQVAMQSLLAGIFQPAVPL